MRESLFSTFVEEPQNVRLVTREGTLKWHATEAAGCEGQPRGNQMLVQALSEFRNLETALEANSWREITEMRQRGSEPEIAQVRLQKESRVREDDAGGQRRLSEV